MWQLPGRHNVGMDKSPVSDDRRMLDYSVGLPAWRSCLIINSKSGGGEAGKSSLARKGEDLGAKVFAIGATGGGRHG